jgi:hypothetical protein
VQPELKTAQCQVACDGCESPCRPAPSGGEIQALEIGLYALVRSVEANAFSGLQDCALRNDGLEDAYWQKIAATLRQKQDLIEKLQEESRQQRDYTAPLDGERLRALAALRNSEQENNELRVTIREARKRIETFEESSAADARINARQAEEIARLGRELSEADQAVKACRNMLYQAERRVDELLDRIGRIEAAATEDTQVLGRKLADAQAASARRFPAGDLDRHPRRTWGYEAPQGLVLIKGTPDSGIGPDDQSAVSIYWLAKLRLSRLGLGRMFRVEFFLTEEFLSQCLCLGDVLAGMVRDGRAALGEPKTEAARQ